MTYLASIGIGRIALHVMAMISDRAYQWHWAGIRRELAILGAERHFFARDLTTLALLTMIAI